MRTKNCIAVKIYKRNKIITLHINRQIHRINKHFTTMHDDVNQEVVTPNKLLFGRILETKQICQNVLSTSRNKDLDHWWNRWRKNYILEHRNSINTNRINGLSFPKQKILYSLLSAELVGSQNLFQVQMVKSRSSDCLCTVEKDWEYVTTTSE